MNPWIALLLFIIAGLAAGFVGAQVEPGVWYALMDTPPWTLPDRLFAPVWVALYILMGLAAWLAWRPAGWRSAHSLFALQLILNAAWPWVFFGLHRTGWAMAELALMWLVVLITLVGFWRIRRGAGLLLVPYLLWLSYAWVLNYRLWQLHGGRLLF